MKLYQIVLPVAVVAVLQASGCTSSGGAIPPGGTYRSESAGAHFDQSVMRSDGEEGAHIASFVLRQADQPTHAVGTILVAAANQGVVRSTDGGANWEQILTPLVHVTDVVALADGVIVIAGTDADGQGFIMRTADDGKSWQTVSTVPKTVNTSSFRFLGGGNETPAVVVTIAPDPFNPTQLYAGTSLGNILAGQQSGKTWQTRYTLNQAAIFASSGANFAIADIIPSPHVQGEVLVRTTQGRLYRISDEVQEQITIPANLAAEPSFIGTGPSRAVFDVAYIPGSPNALFAGVQDGAVISTDRGATWRQLPLPVDTTRKFNTVVVAASPTNPSRLFVAINSVFYRSEDAGDTWATFPLGLPSHAIIEVLVNPENAAHMLLITTPLTG